MASCMGSHGSFGERRGRVEGFRTHLKLRTSCGCGCLFLGIDLKESVCLGSRSDLFISCLGPWWKALTVAAGLSCFDILVYVVARDFLFTSGFSPR